jgi:hypothetical protein
VYSRQPPASRALPAAAMRPGLSVPGDGCRVRQGCLLLGVIFSVAVGLNELSAQTSGPAAASAPAGLIRHLDPALGFELSVPAGWIYDRARFAGPYGSLGVVRGKSPTGAQALQVLVFRSTELTGFSAWLDWFAVRLSEAYAGRRIPRLPRPEANDERTVLLIDTPTAGGRTQTYYLCVPFDASTVWVLVFAGLVQTPEDEQQLRTLFEQMADSVRVLYSPLEAEKIALAFERGLEVLARLRREAADLEVEPDERFYEISIAGKPIGYLRRSIRREELRSERGASRPADRPGLRVDEESWRFADDGTVRHTELNFYSSADLQHELIEVRTTQIPAPDVPAQRLYIELDQVVREGQALVTSFSTNLDVELPEPRPPIPIGPRYLDGAWVRLLPRLLRDARPEAYAFAVYDSPTRGLMVYMIEPLGPAEVPGLSGVSGLAFLVREGFVTQPSRVFADRYGNVLRVEAGELTLSQVSREEVERRWAARREPARQRMQPAPRPRLP